MLVNFEDYTADLNTDEVAFALDIAIYIQANCKTPTPGHDICDYFNDPVLFPNRPKLDGAKLRKYINYICKTMLHNLIGTSKGYYVTNDIEELKRAAGTLQSRANENTRRAEVIIKYLAKQHGVKYGGK